MGNKWSNIDCIPYVTTEQHLMRDGEKSSITTSASPDAWIQAGHTKWEGNKFSFDHLDTTQLRFTLFSQEELIERGIIHTEHAITQSIRDLFAAADGQNFLETVRENSNVNAIRMNHGRFFGFFPEQTLSKFLREQGIFVDEKLIPKIGGRNRSPIHEILLYSDWENEMQRSRQSVGLTTTLINRVRKFAGSFFSHSSKMNH